MNRRQFILGGGAVISAASLTGCKELFARFQTLDVQQVCGTAAAFSGFDPQSVAARSGLQLQTEPLVIDGSQRNVVIANRHFKDILGDASYAIHVKGHGINEPVNIRIENCLFENCRWAVRVDFSQGVTIAGNRFENCGQAIRVSSSTRIRVEYNEFESIGTHEVLNHGYGKYWAQNAVNFIEVQGCGNSVNHNLFDYGSRPAPYLEDIVSLWNSGGIKSSWLEVIGNRFRGGTPGSNTGAGIVAGDAVGAKILYAHHVRIADNILVRTQNIGIGIAGGYDMDVINNRVYMPLEHVRQLRQHPHNREDNQRAGAGIVIFDYSKTLKCQNFQVESNQVFATRADNVANPWWISTETCKSHQDINNRWVRSLEAPADLGEGLLPVNLFANLPRPYFSAAE